MRRSRRANTRKRLEMRAWVTPTRLVALCMVVVPLLFLSDVLLFQKVFYYFDFEVQWIPFHQFVHNALAAGESLLWNPYIMLGFPQHAESQVGAFYPLNIILHLLSNQAYAVALSFYAHLVLGLCATYGLARAYRLEQLAALHAAFCFAFSGFIFAQLTNYNIALTAVYLPLKLLCITYYFERRRAQYLLYFALVSGAELLISHANMSFITSATAGLYFVVLAVLKRESVARDLVLYALASLFALLLAAVQLIPTFEFFTQSERSAGISYEMATSYSHSFSQYLTAFFPLMYGAGSIGFSSASSFEESFFFIGTFGILLAIFGAMVCLRQRDNRYVIVLAVLGVVGLGLSLGANNPFVDLYRWLVALPGFSLFRAPARWSVVPTLALAILSGYGLQIFLSRLRTRQYGAVAATVVVMAVMVPLLVYGLGWKDVGVERALLGYKLTHPLSVDLSYLGWLDRHLYAVFAWVSPLRYWLLATALLAALACCARWLPLKVLAVVIVVVSVIDLLLVIRPLNPKANADFFAVTPPHIQELQAQAGVARVASSDQLPNMAGMNSSVSAFYGLQGIKGYASLRLNNYVWIYDQLSRSDIKDYVGVEYDIERSAEPGIGINGRAGAFPRAFLLERYATESDEAAAFRTFLDLNDAQRKSYAILSHRSAGQLGLYDQAGVGDVPRKTAILPIEIAEYHHARVKMQGETQRPAFAVLTDMYYPGWRARVNDRETPIVPIHGVFRGVYLAEPGPFTIEMSYEPWSFKLGTVISLLALIVAGGTGYIYRVTRRRSRHTGDKTRRRSKQGGRRRV